MQIKLFRVDLKYPLHLVTISFKTLLIQSFLNLCFIIWYHFLGPLEDSEHNVSQQAIHNSAPDLVSVFI